MTLGFEEIETAAWVSAEEYAPDDNEGQDDFFQGFITGLRWAREFGHLK